MVKLEPLTPQQYRAKAGQEIGLSDWILVDQERIDRFGEVTGDRNFIHTDAERARATPLGGTIAHGYLTLSLLAAMADTVLPPVMGSELGLNYGLNSVRFLAPVRSGKRIRGRFTLDHVTERLPGQWQLTFTVSVEIEGEAKPALVAQWLTLTVIGQV